MRKRKALEGIKVADFSWVIAAPLATKYLADHGATVVRIESAKRPELGRAYVPYAGGIPGVNRSAFFAAYNSSKYSIALNLEHPEGLDIAHRLVSWSDVVVESFMPGTMERFGLGYDDLKEIKSDIIMVRASMQGQTGPHAFEPGYGVHLQALSGLTTMLGWPDRDPRGAALAYTDFIGPWYVVVAVIAALDYHRRTGESLYVDLSQFEAGVSFLSPAVLDYTANGRIQGCNGNRCPNAAPHNAYRCRGEGRADERWCVIAVWNDEEWGAFCQAIGSPDWTKSPRFSSLQDRKDNEDELDRLVEAWTINHTPEEVMFMLQHAGVEAGVVENGRDLHEDPQLKHRQHFWFLEHPEMGRCAYDGPSFRLSETPADLNMPAPCLGQHNEYVCTKILGISDEEFVRLYSAGAFG